MSYTLPVSPDDFSGFMPDENMHPEVSNNRSLVHEAMELLQHPELHAAAAGVKIAKGPVPKAVRSRMYDLSAPKDRKDYEEDVMKIVKGGKDGTVLLLDHPPKQFVQSGDAVRYIAYLEWVEYEKPEPMFPEARKTRKRAGKA